MIRALTSVRQLGCVAVDGLRGGVTLGWQWARHAASSAGGDTASLVLRDLDVNMPKSVKDLIPPLEPRKPDVHSQRTGLVAVKVGMVSEWDEYGKLTPYTVLWVDENQVSLSKSWCLVPELLNRFPRATIVLALDGMN